MKIEKGTKYFWLVDDDGDEFITILEAKTREAAISAAKDAWDHLTASEQKKRKAFYLTYGPVLSEWLEEDDTMDASTTRGCCRYSPDEDRCDVIMDFKAE